MSRDALERKGPQRHEDGEEYRPRHLPVQCGREEGGGVLMMSVSNAPSESPTLASVVCSAA